MKVKHRLLALVMSVMMIVTYMPALAFAAEEDAAGADDPVYAEDQVQDEGTDAASQDEDTVQEEPAEVESSEAEEASNAADEEPAVVQVVEEQTKEESGEVPVASKPGKIVPGAKTADDDELLEKFFDSEVDKALGKKTANSSKKKSARTPRRSRLNSTEQYIYDQLLAKMQEIACGEESKAEFKVDLSGELDAYLTEADADGRRTMTSETLGIEEPAANVYYDEEKESYWWDLSDEAKTTLFDILKVVDAVLIDNPYPSYWFDKVEGYNGELSANVDVETGDLYFDSNPCVSFRFTVSQDYRAAGGGEYDADTGKTGATVAAVATVEETVAKNADKDDLGKLYAYKDAICDMTSYNDEAAENEAMPYGDPWQLIWVFDGDDSTKVVCEGYSKAFQYLCEKSSFSGDIGCNTVTGTMYGGTGAGAHMWNILSMDDNRNYIADITNCDTDEPDEDGSYPNDLFLAAAMLGGHWDEQYCFDTNGDGNSDISYEYDDETKGQYDWSELTLSELAYGETIEISYSTSHVFYENCKGYQSSYYDEETGQSVPCFYYKTDKYDGDVLIVNDVEYTFNGDNGMYVADNGDEIDRNDVCVRESQEPWIVGGDNYYTVEYKGQETRVKATLEAAPNLNINYQKLSVIEYTEGCYETGEDGEEEWFRYNVQPGEGDTLTVDGEDYFYTYDDDDNWGFFNSDRSKKLDDSYFSIEELNSQSEEHWVLGDNEETKAFPITVNYKGNSIVTAFTLEKNPVSSISYTRNKEFIENKNGHWDEEDDFFMYQLNPEANDVLTVNDTEFVYSYNESKDEWGFFNGDEEAVDVSLNDDQHYTHWVIPDGELETTVTFTVTYMGRECEAEAKLIKNPVTGIKYTPVNEYYDAIELADGNYDEESEDGNRIFRYYEPGFEDGDILTVSYRDKGDVTYVCEAGGDAAFVNQDDSNDIIYIDEDGISVSADQSTQWTAGNTYETTVVYEGQEAPGRKVRIVENPVVSISFSRNGESRIELTEGKDSDTDWGYSENGERMYYERYNMWFEFGDRLTVTLNDGSTAEYEYKEIGTGRHTAEKFANIKDESDVLEWDYLDFYPAVEQSCENPWKAGKSYPAKVTYMGREADVEVNILKNPVTKVVYETADGSKTLKLPEYVDGNWVTDWDENDNDNEVRYFWYRTPDFSVGDKITVTKNDALYAYAFKRHVYNSENDCYDNAFVNVADSNDVIYEYEVDHDGSNQSGWDNPWLKEKPAGADYHFIYKYYGVKFDVPVEIVENPVKSFAFSRDGYDADQPIVLTEGLDADINSDGGDKRYFEYYLNFKNGDTLKITDPQDKTSEYKAVPYNEYDSYADYFENDKGDRIETYDVEQNSDQSFKNQWTAGDTVREINLEYFARQNPVKVIIKKNPVQALKFVRPGNGAVELVENGDGFNDGDYFHYEINFKAGDELYVTYDGQTEAVKYVAAAASNGKVYEFEAAGAVPEGAEKAISSNDIYFRHNSSRYIAAENESNFIMLMYKGMWTDVPVKVKENTVEGIEFSRTGAGDRIELEENKDGWKSTYYEEEGKIEVFNYYLDFEEGDSLSVKYAGTADPVRYNFEYTEDGYGCFKAEGKVPDGAPEMISGDDVRQDSHQGPYSIWELGKDYEIELCYLGSYFNVPVTIVNADPYDINSYTVSFDEKYRKLDQIESTPYDDYFYAFHFGTTGIKPVVEKDGVKLDEKNYTVRYSEVVFDEAANEWGFAKENDWSETFPTKVGVYLCEVSGKDPYKGTYEGMIDLIKIEDHTWDDGTVTKEATCTEDGVMTFKCKECSETKTEVIKATGHTEEVVPGKAATCTEAGLTEGKKCSVCGEVIEAQKEIPATGHKWSETEYTWNEDNTKVTASHTCENEWHTGNKTVTETVGAKSEVIKAATLTENGEVKYISEAFANEGFEVQTKTVKTDKLDLDEALKEADDQAKEADQKADAADKAADTSTDDKAAEEAEAKAQAAANLAAEAEAAAVDAQKSAADAQAAAAQTQADAAKALAEKINSGASEEEIKKAEEALNTAQANLDTAQKNYENATKKLAVAKKITAAASSSLAKAKKAGAKVAANKAAAASEAAKTATNAAAAEELRKEAEAQAAKAAEKAKAADEASEAAKTAAEDLSKMAQETEAAGSTVSEEVKQAISDAKTEAEKSKTAASQAAEAADTSKSEADTSKDEAQQAVDDKTAAEKAAELEKARQGVYDKSLPKMKIGKPSAKKTTLTVKWTKLSKKQLKKSKATKYEIWVCTDKKFAANKTIAKMTSKSKSSIKIKKLKKKTTYYVKIRAIKYVGGVKHVGKWSSVKKIKIKK